MTEVTFTPSKVRALERMYKEALRNGEQQIVFDDHIIIVEYAKYLIEYLNTLIKEQNNG